jgi:Undecaprenyl-phosphate glucose phosphotransferase
LLITRLPSASYSSADGRSFDWAVPAATKFRRLNLHAWIAPIACLDLTGAAVLSVLIFRGYAAPLNYDWRQLWAGLGAFVVAWLLASHSQGLYQQKYVLAGRRMLLRATATCALAFGIVLALAFGSKLIGGVSRLWLLTWAAGVFAWVMILRIVWRRCLKSVLRSGRDKPCLERALVLAGSSEAASRLAAAVESESGHRIRVAASAALPGLQGAPSFAWIEDVIRNGAADRVMIADFEEAKDETNALLGRLIRLAVDVTLMPNFAGIYTPLVQVNQIGWIPAVDIATRPLSARQAIIKRIEDLVVASLALLAALPALAVIALAIKLDSPGPALFRQKRVGFHDTTFLVWKFRTMHHNMEDHGSVRQTTRTDPRVTRVGRLLRKTSLDEVPQLVNVLRGEMSIVGPRPHALNTTAAGVPLHEALEEYASRHRIKPGITGWAQVKGCRGEIDSEAKLRRRVSLDSFYIENWSLALDAWIMMRTLALIAVSGDAY